MTNPSHSKKHKINYHNGNIGTLVSTQIGNTEISNINIDVKANSEDQQTSLKILFGATAIDRNAGGIVGQVKSAILMINNVTIDNNINSNIYNGKM